MPVGYFYFRYSLHTVFDWERVTQALAFVTKSTKRVKHMRKMSEDSRGGPAASLASVATSAAGASRQQSRSAIPSVERASIDATRPLLSSPLARQASDDSQASAGSVPGFGEEESKGHDSPSSKRGGASDVGSVHRTAHADLRVPPWLMVKWGRGLAHSTPLQVRIPAVSLQRVLVADGHGCACAVQTIMRRAQHSFSVENLNEVTRIVTYWEGSLGMGVFLFGIHLDMAVFKAVLSVLGTVLPIILTRILAQWSGTILG